MNQFLFSEKLKWKKEYKSLKDIMNKLYDDMKNELEGTHEEETNLPLDKWELLNHFLLLFVLLLGQPKKRWDWLLIKKCETLFFYKYSELKKKLKWKVEIYDKSPPTLKDNE